MRELDAKRLRFAGEPDSGLFLQALLAAASEQGLLSGGEADAVRMKLVTLLARRAEKYTHGESSSLKEETAQDLFSSALYAIGIYLKSLPDADGALRALRAPTLETLHDEGVRMLRVRKEQARRLYQSVYENRLITNNMAYNHTLNRALPDFLKRYDPEYRAHETPALIDYPLFREITGRSGVEYAEAYLNALLWENGFCNFFRAGDIRRLLSARAARYRLNGRDILENLFGIVLKSALASAFSGGTPGGLFVAERDAESLRTALLQPEARGLEERAAAFVYEISGGPYKNERFDAYLGEAAAEAAKTLGAAAAGGRLRYEISVLPDEMMRANREKQL